MKQLFLTILVIALCSSCYSKRQLTNATDFPVPPLSAHELDGVYENAVPGETGISLWQDLLKNKSHKDVPFNPRNTAVELILLSDKKVQANLYRNNVLEDSMILKGRMKDDYFVVNRRVKTIPLIPLVFTYAENKTILGTDVEGNLVLIQGQMDYSVLLLSIQSSGDEIINGRYRRMI
jgi:hypothetical protein